MKMLKQQTNPNKTINDQSNKPLIPMSHIFKTAFHTFNFIVSASSIGLTAYLIDVYRTTKSEKTLIINYDLIKDVPHFDATIHKSYYLGETRCGLKQGYGTYITPNSEYNGYFSLNEMCNQGTLELKLPKNKTTTYTGGFQLGKIHGKGILENNKIKVEFISDNGNFISGTFYRDGKERPATENDIKRLTNNIIY